MKIMIYCSPFFPVLGGLQRNTYTLANSLVNLGHTVTLFTETPGTNEEYIFNVVRSSSKKTLYKTIKQSDLVFVNGGVSLKVAVLTFFLRKRYVFIYQTTEGYRNGVGRFLKVQFLLREFFARRAIANVCLTDYALNELDVSPSKKFLLPNPIDSDLANVAELTPFTSLPQKAFDCLYAGRIIDAKGVFVLIQAINLINERHKIQLRLAVAGEGEHLQSFLQKSRELKIQLTYLGRIDKSELVRAYKDSALLIVPSTTHIEGSPLVIAEAIYLRLPVISSDQPAMVEAVGDCGRVFRSGHAESLAKEILACLNPEVYETLQDAISKDRSRFSMATYEKRLANIMKEI